MATRKKAAKKPAKKATKKATKKTAKRATKKKAKSKKGTGARKAAFGGYTINFKNVGHTLEQVFGNKPVTPSEMTKKLWAYVKSHKLNG